MKHILVSCFAPLEALAIVTTAAFELLRIIGFNGPFTAAALTASFLVLTALVAACYYKFSKTRGWLAVRCLFLCFAYVFFSFLR